MSERRDKFNRIAARIKAAAVRTGQLASVLLACAASVQAGDCDRIAATLAKEALRQGSRRLAVLPFEALAGRASAGRLVSERLGAPLAAARGLEVVERMLIESVLGEQRLQASGLVDPRSIKQIGKLLQVDAVVTGTVIQLRGGRVEVHARLIDAESARVIAAASASFERDWEDSVLEDSTTMVPGVPSLPDSGWRDAPRAFGRDDCASAERDADALEREIVRLKARFWAERMRDPNFTPRSLTANPGSEIRNLETKSEFYGLLRRMHAGEETAPALSAAERARLFEADDRVRMLQDRCR